MSIESKKYAVICVSATGAKVCKYISEHLDADPYVFNKYHNNYNSATSYTSLSSLVNEIFLKYTGLIFIMSLGIVNRVIAPHLKSKYIDPAIVVIDDACRFAISAAGGHEGGANNLSVAVGNITGATPVITTATEADKKYIIGLGARKGVTKEAVIKAIEDICKENSIEIKDVRAAATAWLKKDEKGLVDACVELNLALHILPEFLYKNSLFKTKESAAKKHFDIPSVAELSALLSSSNPTLVSPMKVINGVTVAVAKDLTFTEYL